MKQRIIFWLFILTAYSLTSCHTKQYLSSKQSFKSITIKTPISDSVKPTWSLLAPYKSVLDLTMNEVIGENDLLLKKGLPSGSLGNMVCDAMLFDAKKINKNVEIAISNPGGIRIPELVKGNITLGKVYELMPFDNQLSIYTVSGLVLDSICNWIALKGGAPVAGLALEIDQNKIKNILINGLALKPEKQYTIVINDYMSTGGDNFNFVLNLPSNKTNIFIRNSIINYIKHCKENKISITPNPIIRIK